MAEESNLENAERGDVRRRKMDNGQGDNGKGGSQGVEEPENGKEEKAAGYEREEGSEEDSSMPETVDEGVATKIVNGETETQVTFVENGKRSVGIEKQKNRDIYEGKCRLRFRIRSRRRRSIPVNYAELLEDKEEKATNRRCKHQGKVPRTESEEDGNEEKTEKRKDVDSAGKRKSISALKQGSKNGQKKEISDSQENERKKVQRAETRKQVTGSGFAGNGTKCTGTGGTKPSEVSRGCSNAEGGRIRIRIKEKRIGFTCHQCQRSHTGRVVRCKNCRLRRYCIPCINNWYPEMSEYEVESCPVCRDNCNCKACLCRDAPFKALLPRIKKFGEQQMKEKGIETKFQGSSMDEAEKEATQQMVAKIQPPRPKRPRPVPSCGAIKLPERPYRDGKSLQTLEEVLSPKGSGTDALHPEAEQPQSKKTCSEAPLPTMIPPHSGFPVQDIEVLASAPSQVGTSALALEKPRELVMALAEKLIEMGPSAYPTGSGVLDLHMADQVSARLPLMGDMAALQCIRPSREELFSALRRNFYLGQVLTTELTRLYVEEEDGVKIALREKFSSRVEEQAKEIESLKAKLVKAEEEVTSMKDLVEFTKEIAVEAEKKLKDLVAETPRKVEAAVVAHLADPAMVAARAHEVATKYTQAIKDVSEVLINVYPGLDLSPLTKLPDVVKAQESRAQAPIPPGSDFYSPNYDFLSDDDEPLTQTGPWCGDLVSHT